MGEPEVLLAQEFYEEAKKMFEIKDLLGFVAKISVAIEAAGSNREMRSKSTFLLAEGLFRFRQYKKAIEGIDEALRYNEGIAAFTLKKYKGMVYGYFGDVQEALRIFRELIEESSDEVLLSSIYINIAWVLLTIDKSKVREQELEEARLYLDLANNHFAVLPNSIRWKLYNNYSVYYYYKNELDQAVTILKSALQYCEEQDLPYVYENLAEIYLKVEGEDYSQTIRQYTEMAEVIAAKYEDHVALARAFYIKAMSELKCDQFFIALDTLYLAFEYYKRAEAYPYAFDCLVKMNELMNDYKIDRLKSLKESVKADFDGTTYYAKL